MVHRHKVVRETSSPRRLSCRRLAIVREMGHKVSSDDMVHQPQGLAREFWEMISRVPGSKLNMVEN